MKTLTKTLTLDSQFAHLYRPLVRNLVSVIAVTIVLAASTLLYFDHRMVNSLSEHLVESNSQSTNNKLVRLFDSANRALQIVLQQLAPYDISKPEDRSLIFSMLLPNLEKLDFLDSINIADLSGNEYVLIKQQNEIVTRHVQADAPTQANWTRRLDGNVIEQWTRRIDVSPKDRPWYQGALARKPGEAFWTAPYSFLTTKEPGVSVSAHMPGPDGENEIITAFNISLTDISRYTVRLKPSEHGMTAVFDNEGKTIGLPPDPRFEDDKTMLSEVLSPLTSLGIPVLNKAVSTWEAMGRTDAIFSFNAEDRTTWWAGFSSTRLDDERSVWNATLIPAKDFLGTIAVLRNYALAGISAVGVLVAALLFGVSMRSIRQQMKTAVDQVERKLGQYQLKQKIGEGGNGTVYRAQHALLRRPTAIKLMNPEFASSEAARERFEHEVQITSNLSHPNTIAIYDYGQTPEGTLYYAMELLDGSTLENLVRLSGPIPPGRAIHILEQIAGSLAEAHEKNLIHRDIKPSNIILCERGGIRDVVKVLDFGLVKEISQTDGNLTHANVLIGTPLYMAPEIISQPGQASPLSDIYALGAVGYFLLTARNVFEGASAVEICARHLNDAPIPPSERSGLELPADLEGIILACLNKDPAQRPGNAAALRMQLLGCRNAGSWTDQDAREWWQQHSIASLGGGATSHPSTPLSNTELLIDLDNRLVSSAASRT